MHKSLNTILIVLSIIAGTLTLSLSFNCVFASKEEVSSLRGDVTYIREKVDKILFGMCKNGDRK